MKKLLFTLIILLSMSGAGRAQSFNVAPWNQISWDFDSTWLVFQGGSNPKGWFSFNFWPLVNNTMVEQVSPGANGSLHACKITSRATPGLHAQVATIPRDTVGSLFTGILNLAGQPPLQMGFAYDQRPASLSFYSKYTPNGNDTASVLAYIFRQNGSTVDTIGKAVYTETMTSASFALHTMNFVYTQNPPPASDPADRLAIVVSSTSINFPKLGSSFYFDGVTDGLLGLPSRESYNSRIFPNPASNLLQVECPVEYVRYGVLDVSGKLVQSGTLMGGKTLIPTSALPKGAYVLRLESSQSVPLLHRFIHE